MDELNDLLGRAASSVPLTGQDLESVRRRARQVRRRRAVGGIVGVAAALAVVGGIGWAALPDHTSERSVQPAGPSPSTSATEAPDDLIPVKPVVTIDVGQVELQEKQTTAPIWVDNQIQMMGPTDSTISLPHTKLTNLSRFGPESEQRVIGLDNESSTLVVVDMISGKDVLVRPAEQLTVSSDHQVAASTYRGKATVMDATDLASKPVPFAGDVTQIAGIDDPHDTCGADCRVLLSGIKTGQGNSWSYYVAPATGAETPVNLLESTGFVAPDTAVGLVGQDADTACYAISHGGAPATQDQCTWGLHAFNPDGSRVLGLPAYLDGLGWGELAFLDPASLMPTQQFRTQQGDYLVDAQWDGDGSLLAVVWHDSAYVLLKLHEDGSIGHVMNAPGTEGDPAISLPITP